MKIIIICSSLFLMLTASTTTLRANEMENIIKILYENIVIDWKMDAATIKINQNNYLKLSHLLKKSENRKKLRSLIINNAKNNSYFELLCDILKQSSKEEFIVFVKSLYHNKNYSLTKISLTSLYPIWVNPGSGTEKQKNEIYDLMIKLAKSDNFPLSFKAINCLLGYQSIGLKAMNRQKGISILKVKVKQNLSFKEKIKCYELLLTFNVMKKEYCHYLINIIFGDYPTDKIEAKLRLLTILK
jgi:hypothetical protein